MAMAPATACLYGLPCYRRNKLARRTTDSIDSVIFAFYFVLLHSKIQLLASRKGKSKSNGVRPTYETMGLVPGASLNLCQPRAGPPPTPSGTRVGSGAGLDLARSLLRIDLELYQEGIRGELSRTKDQNTLVESY